MKMKLQYDSIYAHLNPLTFATVSTLFLPM